MLKRILNQADIIFKILPKDPLLIKSGHATIAGVDMAFVRTYWNGKPEPFIPGSSMKGMFRAHAERICRTLKDQSVCFPYLQPGKEEAHERNQASCGFRMGKMDGDDEQEKIPSFDAYRLSCAVCRLFGSTAFIGRVAFSDGYLASGSSSLLETRDGIAIDRFTGGVAGGAKFDLEVLTRGEFVTNLSVRNFERWQLGLLGLVLRDLEDGMVRLGSGKSRGLGGIKIEVTSFHLSYYGANSPRILAGLGSQAAEEERKGYGLFAETGEASVLPPGSRVGVRWVHDVTEQWKDLLENGVGELDGFLARSQWPRDMDLYLAGSR